MEPNEASAVEVMSPITENRIMSLDFQAAGPPDLFKKKNQHMNDAFANKLVFTLCWQSGQWEVKEKKGRQVKGGLLCGLVLVFLALADGIIVYFFNFQR